MYITHCRCDACECGLPCDSSSQYPVTRRT